MRMGIDPAFTQAGFNQHRGNGLFSNINSKNFSAHGEFTRLSFNSQSGRAGIQQFSFYIGQ
jgi:hypothetical protein